jgi:hypothetical protein
MPYTYFYSLLSVFKLQAGRQSNERNKNKLPGFFSWSGHLSGFYVAKLSKMNILSEFLVTLPIGCWRERSKKVANKN